MKLSKKENETVITIINVYAPTSERALKHPEEFEKFYRDLNNTINSVEKQSFILLAGDFNAKIGKQQQGETSVGKFSKGKRNCNGERLVEFCEEKRLFVTNSAFNHPSRHITTWAGQRKDKTTGETINIYNQIDFIICQQRHKNLLTNARSYGGTTLTSDHK
ncbi:craniofacial development protein 2-like [Elysia marginata]|uniref:Craniofacial development protein 2-like n=1 Tax=Elysia marginata TaxID=1093978 RepID=A0AAV4FZ15_9GAST|nr:craniofacial development protein 2-like [Elysia marginata]